MYVLKGTMDSECASLLPQVCEVLADSGRSLPDDTSLEKLLDWFTGLTKSGQYRTRWAEGIVSSGFQPSYVENQLEENE